MLLLGVGLAVDHQLQERFGLVIAENAAYRGGRGGVAAGLVVDHAEAGIVVRVGETVDAVDLEIEVEGAALPLAVFDGETHLARPFAGAVDEGGEIELAPERRLHQDDDDLAQDEAVAREGRIEAVGVEFEIKLVDGPAYVALQQRCVLDHRLDELSGDHHPFAADGVGEQLVVQRLEHAMHHLAVGAFVHPVDQIFRLLVARDLLEIERYRASEKFLDRRSREVERIFLGEIAAEDLHGRRSLRHRYHRAVERCQAVGEDDRGDIFRPENAE